MKTVRRRSREERASFQTKDSGLGQTIGVRVEIWSGGDWSRAREIARMKIRDLAVDEYGVCACDPGTTPASPDFEATGLSIARSRNDSMWALLAAATARVAAA